MKQVAPGMRVRCLSCGGTQAELEPAHLRLHSTSDRFAFADCPRCNCLRMMALERADRPATTRRPAQEAVAS